LRLLSVVAAFGIFVGAWALLHHGWFERGQIIDTPVYESYGDQMSRGSVPYRDFGVEYPPGALPAFVLPAVGQEGNEVRFRRSFETLMAACAGLMLLALAVALSGLDVSLPRYFGALALAAIAPLLLGSVVLTRFDLWPAAVTAGALAALVWGRGRLGHGLLGLGIAVKVWPGVILPVAAAYVWRTRGRREALVCLGVAAAVLAAIVVPFAVIAPEGIFRSFERQLTRPLQIESLGAALVVVSHHLLGTGVAMESSHGSQNIGGNTAYLIGGLQSVVQLAVLLAIWIVFARRERSAEELVQFSAAAVVAFIALGKVLSPQFLIWLIPLVVLVRRWSAALLFVTALVLTQAWFPQHYWDYALRFDATITWLVLARDLALIGLLAVLAWPALAELVPRSTRPLRTGPGSDPGRGRSGQAPA
jgi:hypothetical protein